VLTFHTRQIRALEAAATQRFETELVAHGQQFSPRLSAVLGEAGVRAVVRHAMVQARRHGFTLRGPVRLYLETSFLLGSHFDSDPQYPAIASLLATRGDEMDRAMQLHHMVDEHVEAVSGPGHRDVRLALEALAAFAQTPWAVPEVDLRSHLLREMRWAHPAKVAQVGEFALQALIDEGLVLAEREAFLSTRAQALPVVLMFAFGHGCGNDPLYPWISRTLTDPRITDPAARADRLERKSLTWLSHVLGAQPRESL